MDDPDAGDSGGQSRASRRSGDGSLIAKATLASAIVAALAAVIAPIILHSLDNRTLAASQRAAAYSAFISQADAADTAIANACNGARDNYKHGQTQSALAYFARAVNPAMTSMIVAQEELDLVAPYSVVSAAASVGNAITILEDDCAKAIELPGDLTTSMMIQASAGASEAVTHFIRAAGGQVG